MTKSLKVNNTIEAFLIVSLSFSLPFISYKLDKISFQTNDDFGIMSFLAGYSIGEPRPQLVRIFEPLDFILRSLYQINSEVSWYVYFLLLVQAVSYSIIASIVITILKNLARSEQLVILAAFVSLTLMFSLVFFYLQYTQVAIIASGIGTVGIIFRTKRTELLISILILIIGILIRPQAALPASAIVLILTGGLIYINNKEILKDFYNKFFLAAAIAFGAFLVYLLSYNAWAPWISEDTTELIVRQESVRNIYDYRPFEGARELKLSAARKAGFSKNDYELIELYYFADQSLFNSEKLHALEREINDGKNLSVYKKIFNEFIFVFLSENKIYFIFFFLLILLIFYKMTNRPIRSVFFVAATMFFVLFYTLLQGKIPFAVFYATALIALASIIPFLDIVKKNFRLKGSKKLKTEKLGYVITAPLFIFLLFSGYEVYLSNLEKINSNLYWRSDYFRDISEVDKFRNFNYDKPVVAFSSFYSQLEQTQNPIQIRSEDKKIWAETVDIGWTMFEPEYLLHIKRLGLNEDLFSSVAEGKAYVATASHFEIQVVSQYLKEHQNVKVTWVLLPVAESRLSLTGLSVWKVGTARPIRKESN